MKKILIFGATGTVGAYTCIYLKNLGYDVIASGRRTSDNGFFAENGILYIPIDIRKETDFKSLETTPDIYSIINLSGLLPARMRGYNPQQYIDINITGSLNILKFAVKCSCKRVVFTQSISDVAYLCDNPEPILADAISKFPLDNDHSVYSIAKTAACNLLIHYSAKYHFKYFILRLPNIYLYHPNPYYYVDGIKRWQGYRLMIENAIHSKPLQIWGNPRKKKDIVYVKDCCQVIEKTISAKNAESGIYNVGTGLGISMEDQVRGIVSVFSPEKKKSEISFNPDKPDTTEYIFDITKTTKNLGYIPQYSYIDYLIDFKKEMNEEFYRKLWGVKGDYNKI